MIFLLDYDGTYSVNPDFWNKFISDAKEAGHIVYGLTMRYNNSIESIDSTMGTKCEIIYTNRNAKQKFLYEWLSDKNIKPQSLIFIDDQPYFLLNDGQ